MHKLSIILVFFASASSGAQLTCHQPNFTCPGSPISCECQGVATITWEVRLTLAAPDSEPLFSHTFIATGMNESSSNGFTAALCNVTEDPPRFGFVITRLTSNSCLWRMSLWSVGITSLILPLPSFRKQVGSIWLV